jgi:hypothetical protein
MFRLDLINKIEEVMSELYEEEESRPFMDSNNEYPELTRSLIHKAKNHLVEASTILCQIK